MKLTKVKSCCQGILTLHEKGFFNMISETGENVYNYLFLFYNWFPLELAFTVSV